MWLGRFFFFFKQKTAYEMRISDWSSDVCSSDLNAKAQPKKIMLDPMPRALLIPGLGLVGVGKTRKDAVNAGDVAEMAVSIITRAEAIGRFTSIAERDIFDVEYWSLEQIGRAHV